MPRALDILLVEDNEGDVEMTRLALNGHSTPCRLSVAGDGLAALQFLRRAGPSGQEARPDLILLDINMPGMDGKQFLDAVKNDADFKAIPVVMLTSSHSPADVRECYERHASGYVVKPFDAAEFGDAVRHIVDFWGRLARLPS